MFGLQRVPDGDLPRDCPIRQLGMSKINTCFSHTLKCLACLTKII